MSLVLGAAVSHSPLVYRPRSTWADISQALVGEVTQPASRERESEALLVEYERRIGDGLDELGKVVDDGALDALIVLYADRHDVFDDSNFPQLHVQTGGSVWAETALHELSEPSQVRHFGCHQDAAEMLVEELVKHGFDVSEGRGELRPLGAAGRGIGPALGEAVHRLGAGRPVIPIHVNCHVGPLLSGARLQAFGAALGRAAELSEHRLGILVTGGLSGDPGGPMAGWIDDVLDEWVLSRLVRRQVEEIADIWHARSRTLVGSSADIRLWQVGGAALQEAGCLARRIDYLPVHHAAVGVGFAAWERDS